MTPGRAREGHRVRAGRRTVEIHRPGKVLFPDDGLTKADIIGYYRDVAPFMLPHLRGRPLMPERHRRHHGTLTR